MHQQIIILQGPHCLGKTTFTNKIKEMFSSNKVPSPVIISPDQHMAKNGVYDSSMPSERHAWVASFKKLEEASIYTPGVRVIIFDVRVSNSLERKRFVENCFQNMRSGAKLEIVRLANPGIEELQRRNEERAIDRRVPSDYLSSQYSKWLSEPPVKQEGFSKFWNPDEFISYLNDELITPVVEKRIKQRTEDMLKGIVLSDKDFTEKFKS